MKKSLVFIIFFISILFFISCGMEEFLTDESINSKQALETEPSGTIDKSSNDIIKESNDDESSAIGEEFSNIPQESSEPVTDDEYEIYYSAYGLSVIRHGNKYGLINDAEEVIYECKYDYIHIVSEERIMIGSYTSLSDGRAIYDLKGNIIIASDKYYYIDFLSKNHLYVKAEESADYIIIDVDETTVYEQAIKKVDWLGGPYYLLYFEETTDGETVDAPYVFIYEDGDYTLECYDYEALVEKYDEMLVEMTLNYFEWVQKQDFEKLETILVPELYDTLAEYFENGTVPEGYSSIAKTISYIDDLFEDIVQVNISSYDPENPNSPYILLNDKPNGETVRSFYIDYVEGYVGYQRMIISFKPDGNGYFAIQYVYIPEP